MHFRFDYSQNGTQSSFIELNKSPSKVIFRYEKKLGACFIKTTGEGHTAND